MSDDPERDDQDEPLDGLEDPPEVTPAYSTPPAENDEDE
jgi:hypothetical protein